MVLLTRPLWITLTRLFGSRQYASMIFTASGYQPHGAGRSS